MNKVIYNTTEIQETTIEVIQDDEDIYDLKNSYDPITNLETCGNCGNVWDGYAQCYCHGLSCYRKDYTLDTLDTSNISDDKKVLENSENKHSENNLEEEKFQEDKALLK